MFFKPSTCASMWDVSLFHREGTHYLYYLASTRLDRPWDCIGLATSDDGVHFVDRGPVIEKAKDAEWMGGGMVWEANGRYLMNFSESRAGKQSIYFAESADLVSWRRVPVQESMCRLDTRWYSDGTAFSGQRWDGIWVLPREEGQGYIGYLTAVASEGPEGLRGTAGSVYSEDGLSFEAGPPVVPSGLWGDRLEVGGVARLDGAYYMLAAQAEVPLGVRWTMHHPECAGGVYVLRSDHESGPFVPVPSQEPLLVSAPDHYTYFARFYDFEGQALVCHHAVDPARDIANILPKAGTAFAPLKKAVVRDGLLELGWWEGNEACLGSELPTGLELAEGRGLSRPPAGSNGCLTLEAPAGGMAALPYRYDTDEGLVMEFTAAVNEPRGLSFGLGLLIEEEASWMGTMFLLDGRGSMLVGRYNGYGFKVHDTKAMSGRDASLPAQWRLLLKGRLAELYVDDRLVQCYSLGGRAGGRLCLVVEGAEATFSRLTVRSMRL